MKLLETRTIRNFRTVLSFSIKSNKNIRTQQMHTARAVSTKVANNIPKSSALVPTGANRNFMVEAGRVKEPLPNDQPSVGNNLTEPMQSDTSGFHVNASVTTCSETTCHKRLCDTVDKDRCPLKNGVTDQMYVKELAGAMTHKLPAGVDGIKLSDDDMKGTGQPQFLVTEKTAIPIDEKNFKVSQAKTEFVSSEAIAPKIAASLPASSAFALKNTTNEDTPLDEGF